MSVNGYATEKRIIEWTRKTNNLNIYTMLSFEPHKGKYETLYIYDGMIRTIARSNKQNEVLRLHKRITELEPHEIIKLELID